MKLVVDKQELLSKTQIVQAAVASSNNTLPILSHILLDATQTPPKLTATDLELGVSTTLHAEVLEPGALTIPARKLVEIVKELPNIDLTLLGKKNNTITIEGERMVFRLSGFPREEFPKVPEVAEAITIEIDTKTLKNMLERTMFAISQDETRYVLNGALFVLEPNQMSIVSTDGRRLAVCVKPTTIAISGTQQRIVPSKTIHEIVRNLGEDNQNVMMRFSETQVAFTNGQTTITSRLIEGEYPNYRQVVPPPSDQKLRVRCGEFLGAIRRVSLFTTTDSKVVKFDLLKDRVVLSKSTPTLGDAMEEVVGEYVGKEFSIGFNPAFLLDVLKHMKEDLVSLEIVAPDKPGVIRIGSEYTYIVLPMQLSQ